MLTESHALLLGVLLAGVLACASGDGGQRSRQEDHAGMRARMVASQLEARDITDPVVLDAMRRVPRHRFVPPEWRERAYDDGPLPIGHGQTISQPYIVALMTQLVGALPGRRILEIGTGSGYQAAILAECGAEVFTIEIIPDLAAEASRRLDALGYEEVNTRTGDGWQGWPEEAPFDGILVAAAPPEIPQALVEQLAAGGRLVLPVGEVEQTLVVLEKDEDGRVTRREIVPVRFVPMTGGGDEGA